VLAALKGHEWKHDSRERVVHRFEEGEEEEEYESEKKEKDVGKWFSPLVKRFYGGCPTVDIQVLQYLLVVMSGKCAISCVAQQKLQF
jgi:hypothetical protein